MCERPVVTVRTAEPADAEWIRGFLQANWRATTMVVRGETVDAGVLPALIAGDHEGLAT